MKMCKLMKHKKNNELDLNKSMLLVFFYLNHLVLLSAFIINTQSEVNIQKV